MTRGRKSADSLTVVELEGRRPDPPPDLPAAAADLWRAIVGQKPAGYFNAADLVLLRDLVVTAAVIIPRLDRALAGAVLSRDMLGDRAVAVRLVATLTSKLRLNVASRTRPDAASAKSDHQPPWEAGTPAAPPPWE